MLDLRSGAALALVVTLLGCEGHPPKRRAAPSATTQATATAATPTAAPLGKTNDATVKGVTLKAPVDFTPWRAKELERLAAGMRKFRPDATEIEAQALRSKTGGMMAVRLEYPLFVAKGPASVTIRGRLQEELVNAEKGLMGAAPVESQKRETKERDGGLEMCVDGTSSRHVGARVLSCLHLSVDARRRATLLYTMCSEKEGARCRSVVASRAYAIAKPLPLDQPWPTTRRPGLDDLKKDSIGWIEFGMKRPDFEKACKENGGKPNQFAKMDPTQRKVLLKRGKIAQCSGIELETGLGKIVEIDANFESGVLGLAVLDTPRNRTEVIAIANQSLVGLRQEGDISIYELSATPGDDDLAELAVWPAVEGGSGASIQVFSPKALKKP